MLDEDVTTVLDVTAFGGALDRIVSAVAVLVGLGVGFGGIAVYLLSRASSSDVR